MKSMFLAFCIWWVNGKGFWLEIEIFCQNFFKHTSKTMRFVIIRPINNLLDNFFLKHPLEFKLKPTEKSKKNQILRKKSKTQRKCIVRNHCIVE